MPAGLGSIALPLSILVLVLRQKGPVHTFIKAGAISEDTPRRPSSLGIQSEYLIDPLVRSGMLVSTGDGRFYANMRLVRRRSRMIYGVAATLFAVGLACAGWLLWRAWEGWGG